ncbi:Uncharacterised protein [Klebsiella pneumoniae]|nr:Uncharacterised protein [Klebsiella pneumoniae]
MTIVIVIGLEVIDIEEQHVVVVAVQRQQGIEAVLQSAAIIQTGQGIEHTEIVERIAFMHQFIH